MKVGDYVKTTKGNSCNEVTIRKLTYIDEDYNMYILDKFVDYGYGDSTNYISKYDIINSSPDIIDLIEVGDYVNGSKIKSINGNLFNNDGSIDDINIKSIVTKEQFSSMEYKVESEVK